MKKQSQKIKDLEIEISKLHSSVKELKLLNEIAVSSGNVTDIDQILNLIVQKSIESLNAEQSSILLVTQDRNKPFKTIVRQDNTSSLKHTYHIGENITGWVLLYKKSLLIEDLSKDKRFYASEKEKKDIHSVLCVPIWFEGNILGIMMAINKRNKGHFSQDDLTFFTIISVQAGQLIKNLELQRETFLKIKETKKLHELDRIKTNFFTNISHEFRTPLTLILGPLEKLIRETKDEYTLSQYNLINKNANDLLKLINRLLDLSSIDAGKMKLNVEKDDLIIFLKGIAASFNSLADKKNIKMVFSAKLESLESYFDKDKLAEIISNLLSNAVKFTNDKGNIYVTFSIVDKGNVEIDVEDNGIGIPADKINNIFNRFYKVENTSMDGGTGIGLALVKELVELHNGSISVESAVNKGTKFKIILPLKIENQINHQCVSSEKINLEENKIDENSEIDKGVFSDDLPLVLIIEDENDIRKFVVQNIGFGYKTIESSNGKDGFEKSIKFIPDLIISDIVMPEMDGIELCKNIKTDERTCHIPVIFLTAKSTMENKLEGLESGADDFLTKPFNISELQMRIENLIEQRRKLRERFRKELLLEPKDIAATSLDEKILIHVSEIVENHISDYNFSVDTFSKEIGMSRMQLHRKLNALTGESASEFIRNYRLKRAAKLLRIKHGNIAEIAYDVGFNNPSYFSECFRKLFGSLPSEYNKSYSSQNKS